MSILEQVIREAMRQNSWVTLAVAQSNQPDDAVREGFVLFKHHAPHADLEYGTALWREGFEQVNFNLGHYDMELEEAKDDLYERWRGRI